MENVTKFTVDLGERSYDVLVGLGLLANTGLLLAKRRRTGMVRIVCDAAVAEFYLPIVTASLQASGFQTGQPVIMPSGEPSKSFSYFQTLCETLLASHIERSTILVAIGGGVVGDLTGFAAAVLLRGLDYVQIPTTFLAQVDSSIGGKTAINAAFGKNLIGAVHQPLLVMADIETLNSLPRREVLGGYAEMVKHAIILDAAFFDWLDRNALPMLEGDRALRLEAMQRNAPLKIDVVSRDEREQDNRALLNFGHTFGHGLEALMEYDGRLSHGEAVAIGSIMALDLSVRLGLCPEADRDRVVLHYKTVGLPTRVDRAWGLIPQQLINAMQKDKKNSKGQIRFILSLGIGKAKANCSIEHSDLLNLLNDYLK